MAALANALKLLIAALDHVGIPYLVGGSLASSVHGVYRATNDGDIVADINPTQIGSFAGTLGKDWYADPEMMRTAISAGRAFNIIYLPASQKFDIFPAVDAFHATQLARSTELPVAFGGEPVQCRVASAEDILLAKLQWYRDGGEVSDRQWSDITGVLASNPNLDRAYLDSWARRLGVTDLLARAVAQVEREAKE
jgi:hypothetical protein